MNGADGMAVVLGRSLKDRVEGLVQAGDDLRLVGIDGLEAG